jgi:hypothetical protein
MNRVEVTEEALNRVAKQAINLGRLDELVDEIIDLLLGKNKEYKDAWQDFGLFTPLIRIREKLIRLETLIDGRPTLVCDENVMAELVDVIGYGLLAMLWIEGQGDEITFQQMIEQLRQDARQSSRKYDISE